MDREKRVGVSAERVAMDRADDRDRERAVARLHEGFLAGAVSTDTFEARLALALRATRLGDLSALVDDLRRRRFGAARYTLNVALDLARPTVVVGRHASCDVVCEDDSVSRGHALIYRNRGRWQLCDLESMNGTWIDGRRVEKATAVGPGTVIRVGRTDLVLAWA